MREAAEPSKLRPHLSLGAALPTEGRSTTGKGRPALESQPLNTAWSLCPSPDPRICEAQEAEATREPRAQAFLPVPPACSATGSNEQAQCPCLSRRNSQRGEPRAGSGTQPLVRTRAGGCSGHRHHHLPSHLWEPTLNSQPFLLSQVPARPALLCCGVWAGQMAGLPVWMREDRPCAESCREVGQSRALV